MEKRHLSHLNGVFFFESMPTMFRLGLGYLSLLLSQQLKNATAAVFVLYSISIFFVFAVFCFVF